MNLAAGGNSSGGSSLGLLLPLLLVVAFYFFFIRPQRAQMRRQMDVQRTLAPGAEVVLRHGQYGKIESVGDDYVMVEVAPGVTTKFAKQAVGQILTPEQDEIEEHEEHAEWNQAEDAESTNPGPGSEPDTKA